MMLVFDTYTWIEYFMDSPEGMTVESLLENNLVITPTIVLVELCCKAEKEGWDFPKYLNFIKNKSEIVNLNEEVILASGKRYVEISNKIKDFGKRFYRK